MTAPAGPLAGAVAFRRPGFLFRRASLLRVAPQKRLLMVGEGGAGGGLSPKYSSKASGPASLALVHARSLRPWPLPLWRAEPLRRSEFVARLDHRDRLIGVCGGGHGVDIWSAAFSGLYLFQPGKTFGARARTGNY